VAFLPIPAATFVTPVTGDPLGVAARRLDVMARDPDVSTAVPAVITTDPDPTFMGTRTRVFDDDRRWADANVNVLREC